MPGTCRSTWSTRARAYEVKAAVPGFSPEEVELTYGSFARSVQLPGDVKEDQIKASFENGILVIEIPKVPAAQPRKIAIGGKSQKQLVGVGSQR